MHTLISVAGNDPGAGVRAGLQADAEMAQWIGVHFSGVIAVDTEQDADGLRSVQVRQAEEVEENLQRALVDAIFQGEVCVKAGALGNAELVRMLARVLEDWPEVPLVVDPVRQASLRHAGVPDLLDLDGWEVMREELFPRALLVTPNAQEYGNGEAYAKARAVLLTGGDAASEGEVIDKLLCDGEQQEFRSERLLGGERLHGTGCRLSAAIAACYTESVGLLHAIESGRGFLRAWMQVELRRSGND